MQFFLITPVVLPIIVVCLAGVGLLLDWLIIEPMSWVLEQPTLERNIKMASLIALLVGFHFDFLTS